MDRKASGNSPMFALIHTRLPLFLLAASLFGAGLVVFSKAPVWQAVAAEEFLAGLESEPGVLLLLAAVLAASSRYVRGEAGIQ